MAERGIRYLDVLLESASYRFYVAPPAIFANRPADHCTLLHAGTADTWRGSFIVEVIYLRFATRAVRLWYLFFLKSFSFSAFRLSIVAFASSNALATPSCSSVRFLYTASISTV